MCPAPSPGAPPDYAKHRRSACGGNPMAIWAIFSRTVMIWSPPPHVVGGDLIAPSQERNLKKQTQFSGWKMQHNYIYDRGLLAVHVTPGSKKQSQCAGDRAVHPVPPRQRNQKNKANACPGPRSRVSAPSEENRREHTRRNRRMKKQTQC